MPDDLDWIVIEFAVRGEHGAVRPDGQGNDHAVERIFVMRRQHFGLTAGISVQRDNAQVVPRGDLFDEGCDTRLLTRQLDFPQPQLAREFPHADAKNNRIARGRQGLARDGIAPSSAGQIENRAGIEDV